MEIQAAEKKKGGDSGFGGGFGGPGGGSEKPVSVFIMDIHRSWGVFWFSVGYLY